MLRLLSYCICLQQTNKYFCIYTIPRKESVLITWPNFELQPIESFDWLKGKFREHPYIGGSRVKTMVSCSFSGFSPHQPIEGIERPRAGFYPLSGIPEYLAVAIKPHIDAILTGLSFAKALPGSLYRCTKSGDFKTTISNKLNYIQYIYIYILTYIEYTYVYLYIRIYIYYIYITCQVAYLASL